MTNFVVREVGSHTDFDHVNSLIRQTLRKTLEKENMQLRYTVTGEQLQKNYLNQANAKGFEALQEGRTVAFMGVQWSTETGNGYISYGYEEGTGTKEGSEVEEALSLLLQQCEQAVRTAGGTQICRFLSLQPGKIRNEEFTFWERLGFIADDYFHTLIKLEVDEWQPPSQLNTTGVTPATDAEISQIISMLESDNQHELAEDFIQDFKNKSEEYTSRTPDHVFLKLQSSPESEIAAIAYYQVVPFKDKNRDGKSYDGVGAFSAGFHFRPHFQLPRSEKRRFIQAVIQSMKELNIIFASTRIGSRDFDAFIEMLAEGFYFQGDDPMIRIRLTKQV